MSEGARSAAPAAPPAGGAALVAVRARRQRAQAGEGARHRRRCADPRSRGFGRPAAAAAARASGSGSCCASAPRIAGRSCGCGSMRPRATCGARTSPRCCAAGALPDGMVVPKVSAAGRDRRCRAVPRARSRRGFGSAPAARACWSIATETPAGAAGAAAVPGGARRLHRGRGAPRRSHLGGGGPEHRARGARATREASGALTFTFQLARTHVPAGGRRARGAGDRRRAHRFRDAAGTAARARERAPRRLHRQARHPSRTRSPPSMPPSRRARRSARRRDAWWRPSPLPPEPAWRASTDR